VSSNTLPGPVPRVLFLVVHYRNTQEVAHFCEQVSRVEGCLVVVTDNSGDLDAHLLPERCVVATSGCNLGYLNGCAFGFEQVAPLLAAIPEFICVCNTDISFTRGLEKLTASQAGDDTVGCIAPDIILPTGHHQNPNILWRPSRRRLNRLISVHHFASLGAVYMLLARAKARLLPRLSAPHGPMDIYGCHGSCMILTRHFFLRGGVIRYGGFLHDEELHIAEQVRRAGLVSRLLPDLVIVHHAHSSLGSVQLMRQSAYHKQSLTWIRSEYFD